LLGGRVVVGRGRRVVVVAGLGRRVVVGALVDSVVAGSDVVVGGAVVVVGAGTSDVTIEVTVTVRTGCSSCVAFATKAPSKKPPTPSTHP
jgi:hypothetical protein